MSGGRIIPEITIFSLSSSGNVKYTRHIVFTNVGRKRLKNNASGWDIAPWPTLLRDKYTPITDEVEETESTERDEPSENIDIEINL